MKRLFTIVFLVLSLAISGVAQAAGELEFSQGVALFKQNAYADALKKFEAARKAGMREPKLDFNQALCNLKLQHYDAAYDAFQRAAKYKPLQSLAYFNIALLELERGNSDQAREWLLRVSKSAAEPKLRALAERKLRQIDGVSPLDASPVWSNGYSLSVGYDDNIEDPTLIGTTNKGDSFASAIVYLTRSDATDNGIRLGLIGFTQQYSTVSTYDLNLLQLLLDNGWRVGSWRNRVGAEYESSTLGGNAYLGAVKLYLSGKRDLTPLDELRLRYRYSTFSSLSPAYDYLDGSRHEVEMRWQHRRQDLTLQSAYEFELNERNDYRSTTTPLFSSYSPTRHTIDLRADANLTPEITLDGRLTWRASLYNQANVLADSSRITRNDDSLSVGLGLGYALTKDLSIECKYKFTENHSNIATYHYTRHIYTLGIKGKF